MTDTKIDVIVGELRGEEERLKGELTDLKKQMEEITRELRTVQSGLAGLVGKVTPRKRGSSKKRASSDKATSDDGDDAREQETPKFRTPQRVTEIALDEFP